MATVTRRSAGFLWVVLVFALTSCTSIASKGVEGSTLRSTPLTIPKGTRVLSRVDMDHVLDAKLSRRDAATFLSNIRVNDYDLPDPNTNWSHADYSGANLGFTVYFFTYRGTFFILLLEQAENGVSNCADIVIMKRPTPDYELGMGQVEINRDHVDRQVVVIFNRNWNGNYSDDVLAAFRPNIEERQIESVHYDYIRILREQ